MKRRQRVAKRRGGRVKPLVTLPSFHADDRVRIWPSGADWLIFLETCKSIWLVRLTVTTEGMLRIFLTSFLLVNFASLYQGRKLFVSENCKGWQAAHLHWRKTFENLLHIASVRRTLSGILHFKHRMMIWLGSNGGVVVRALPSHQCGPGSVPRSDALCGLSLLLVLSLAPRGFSPGTLVFPSPQNQHFQIPIRPGIR